MAFVGTAVETVHRKVAGPGNFQGIVLASVRIFMFQVQSYTRDIPENHLTPHPLKDQLSFLPPPALSNPSPVPHTLSTVALLRPRAAPSSQEP